MDAEPLEVDEGSDSGEGPRQQGQTSSEPSPTQPLERRYPEAQIPPQGSKVLIGVLLGVRSSLSSSSGRGHKEAARVSSEIRGYPSGSANPAGRGSGGELDPAAARASRTSAATSSTRTVITAGLWLGGRRLLPSLA